MSNLEPHQKKIADSIQDIFDKHGIERAVVVCNDPDRDQTITLGRGEVIWRVGALACKLWECLNEWEIPQKKEEQDV